MLNTLRAIKDAQEIYYLANGSYATDFAELNIAWPTGSIKEQTETSIEYEDDSKYHFYGNQSVYGYPKGVNQEVSLEYYYDHTPYVILNGKISCMENPPTTKFAVCKALGGTFRIEREGKRYWTLSL